MRLAWIAVALAADLTQDPLKRIVQLLNDLSMQVEHEGEEEKRLYEKFMCWCASGGKEEEEALEAQKFRIERLHPAIEHAAEQVEKLDERIKEMEHEVAEHEQAKAGAESLRGQEEEKFKTDSEVLKQTVSGLDKALQVLRHARDVHALVQAGNTVKQALSPFAQNTRVRTALDDRQVQALLSANSDSFLQARGGSGWESDHIIGVLDGLREGFAHDLTEAEKTEGESVAAFDALMASKGKELVAARTTLRQLTEEKTGLNAQLARDRDDLAATQVSYAQDNTAYQERKHECETKTQEFHDRQQARLEEMLAINEATQVLSADDVHVVFSKTVERGPLPKPGLLEATAHALPPSFLQVTQQATQRGDPHDVLTYVQELSKANPGKPLLAQLALKLESMSGQSFERVIQVINKQIEIIDMEQAEDDKKKTWCESEIQKNTQSIEAKIVEKKDFEAQIGNNDADLTLLRDEVAQMAKEIDEIGRMLDDARRQREEEASSFDTTMAELKTAQTALVKAIQVLEGFYGQQALLQQQAEMNSAMQEQTQVNQLVDQQTSAGYYETGTAVQQPATPSGEYKGAAGGRSILKLLGTIGEDLVHEEEARRADEGEAKRAFSELQAQTAMNTKLKQEQLIVRREQIARLEQTREGFQSDADAAIALINELKARKLDLDKNCYILEQYDRRQKLRKGERDAMEKAIQILS